MGNSLSTSSIVPSLSPGADMGRRISKSNNLRHHRPSSCGQCHYEHGHVPDRERRDIEQAMLISVQEEQERSMKEAAPHHTASDEDIARALALSTEGHDHSSPEHVSIQGSPSAIRSTPRVSPQLGKSPSQSSTRSFSSTQSKKSIDFSKYNPNVLKVLNGELVVVSYEGTSQYSQGGGSSACGLAALNCARIVLGHEKTGVKSLNLLDVMMQRSTAEDITSICHLWNGSHLEVDELENLPIFQHSLDRKGTKWGEVSGPGFGKVLDALKEKPQFIRSAVITRTPEIIICFWVPLNLANRKGIYAIFDSHPRPMHPDGAAFIFSPTKKKMLDYLSDLIQFDKSILDFGESNWQLQLLSQYSAHFFSAKPPSRSTESESVRVLMELSVSEFSARKQVEDLKSELRDAQQMVKGMETRYAAEQRKAENWVLNLQEQKIREQSRHEEEVRKFKEEMKSRDEWASHEINTLRGAVESLKKELNAKAEQERLASTRCVEDHALSSLPVSEAHPNIESSLNRVRMSTPPTLDEDVVMGTEEESSTAAATDAVATPKPTHIIIQYEQTTRDRGSPLQSCGGNWTPQNLFSNPSTPSG
ncbi:hypothetical protein AX16_002294 [Volvariella volvacea WC 439]|nr:hypothetical protein AX16_002294 [Volvariella volvacea WC 439]